jgi:poly(A) polymerase
MTQPYKDAIGICKTISRNGYDAYVMNSQLKEVLSLGETPEGLELDILTDMDLEELLRVFPQLGNTAEDGVTAILKEGAVTFRFYPMDMADGVHPESVMEPLSPRMLKKLEERGQISVGAACPVIPSANAMYDGFADMASGQICFAGDPDQTLRRNFLLGVRALRFSANYGLPLDDNTRVAIVRSSQRILDYVSVSDIMDEWRKVEAENMWAFVKLLFDTMLLHGLAPELAGLSRVMQLKNDSGTEETVFGHTLEVMRHYPEELPYDWFGTMACLFHDVGKLFTADFFDGKWHFHQHHRIGAQVSRKILNRLRMPPDEVDLICHLVRHHMRFHHMLTDKGIRRFKALDEYPRIIEMARADTKARERHFTDFNHNMKMLERADTPEEMLEPLLNGNEIMDFADLKPGPIVGIIREALLKAQIAGAVSSVPEAVDFVINYKEA